MWQLYARKMTKIGVIAIFAGADQGPALSETSLFFVIADELGQYASSVNYLCLNDDTLR